MKYKNFLTIFCFLVAQVGIDKIKAQAPGEMYRPQIHFTPKTGWMNDPNGMFYYNNTYHLYYQYYPNSSVWGPMHWGHATSKDLVHKALKCRGGVF